MESSEARQHLDSAGNFQGTTMVRRHEVKYTWDKHGNLRFIWKGAPHAVWKPTHDRVLAYIREICT